VGASRASIAISPPVTVASSGNVTTPSTATKTITVNYMDPSGVNTATLGTGDIAVTGPAGFSVTPAFQSFTTSGSITTATYTFNPPNGIWQSANNGAYSIKLQPGAVADTAGNSVGQQMTVATFSVALETIPPTVDTTDFVLQQFPSGTQVPVGAPTYDTVNNTATFPLSPRCGRRLRPDAFLGRREGPRRQPARRRRQRDGRRRLRLRLHAAREHLRHAG